MKVIIAEKPSVAKNIADALSGTTRHDGYIESKDYYITWAFGHLLTLWDSKDYNPEMAKWKMENFPFIPSEFKYKVKGGAKDRDKPDPGAKAQLKVIKDLIAKPEVTHVVSATDFDREGQVIGDIILQYLKITKPIERLLLNEWTPDEVRKGLSSVVSNSTMKSVSDAGVCRQWADWTIGINLTSAATLKYKRGKGPLNIGRVLLPTLKIIYDRDKEIEAFKPEAFYKMTGTFKTAKGNLYEGTYQLKGKEKFSNKDSLSKMKDKAKSANAVVSDINTEAKKEYAPLLFNLSGLQGQVTSKYSGWTSGKVLKVAQSLYEKKFITYPRTASVVLEETLVDRAEKVLNVLKKGTTFEKDIKFFKNPRVFNTKKVEGHSAIIPTYMLPQSLTKDESIVYQEVVDRFLMQFLPVHEYNETILKTTINGIAGEFVSKGKIITVQGWKILQSGGVTEVTLPNVKKSEAVDVDKITVTSHKTTPPKFHTEKTLLRVMETCGRAYNETSEESEMMNEILNGFSIGTPATRAETISKLTTAGYVESKGKNLMTTELGKGLVESFPIADLFDLEYTGRLEKTLSDIEKGKYKKDEFLNLIFEFTKQSVETIKNDKGGKTLNNINENTENEVLGLCPLCGNGVTESERNFGCTGWKEGCKYAIWKNDRFLDSVGAKPTAEMVKKLLKEGKVLQKGLVSKKKGTTYDAFLSLEKNPENGYLNWKMEFPERDKP